MTHARSRPSAAAASRAGAPAFSGTTFAGRFFLERELGRGGFGTVFAARDLRHDARVAVKILRRPDPAALARFKRELRSLATIAHPNVVELYELVHDAGRYALAMELVPGVDLRTHLRGGGAASAVTIQAGTALDVRALPRTPPGTRDEREVLAALGQLVDGIEALHEGGVLHCDLKPSNVLVAPDGRVVIVDFGLVTTTGGVDDAWSARRVGTPGYMAPEVAEGLRPTEATDWYAFGAVLFELWSGQLPFEGTAAGILEAVRRHEAPLLSAVCPDAPGPLVALCARLLAREPRRRAAALEVREVLALGPPRARHARRLGTAAEGEPRTPELFLGRERELAAMADALALAAGGRSTALVIAGVSGIGKTALVRRFVRSLAGSALVVETACHPREDVPYGALDGLAACLHAALADTALAHAAPDGELAALGLVFPALASLVAAPASDLAADPVARRMRAARAAAAVLAGAAAGRPVALVVDDLHWADRDSESLLRLLLDALPRALLLATYQRGDEPGEVPWPALVEPGAPLSVLELAPLSRATAELLATALSGDAARGRHIAHESTGQPFLVCELARVQDLVVSDGEQPSVQAVVGARLAALGPKARRLLEVLAIAGGPLDETLAATAAGCGAEGPRCVRALLARGVAKSVAAPGGEPRIAPYHALFASVAAGGLDAQAVRALHAALARAIEGRRGGAREDALATHWLLAGEPARAAPHARAAAERALRALAFERAAELFGVAAEHADVPERHSDLMARRGDALVHAGHGKQAAAAYLASAGTAAPGLAAVELRRRAAEQLLRSGHLDEGMDALGDVLRTAGLPGPVRGAARLARLLAARARARTALSIGGPARDEAGRQRARLQADVLWAASAGLGFVDPVAGAEYSSRFVVAALQSGDPARAVRALASEAIVRVGGGEPAWREVTALLARARRIAEHHADRLMLGRCEGALGVAAAFTGRFAMAARSCAAAEVLLGEHGRGATWELATVQHLALYASVHLGELSTVCARAPELLRDYRAREDLYAASGAATHYANLAWLVTDGPVRAREVVRGAASWFPAERFHLPHYDAVVAHVHLDLFEQRASDALGRAEELWRALRSSLLLRVEAVLVDALFLRTRALVALAAANRAERGVLLARAALDVARLARTQSILARALALLTGASVLDVAGFRARACRRLGRAIEALDAVDARLLAASARFRLGLLRGGSEGAALAALARPRLVPVPACDLDAFTAIFTPGFQR
ncbi:MAG: protein kinase [Myxococcales bacterium]|nr:protein kinase [Myxococcales bacterium]